MTFLADTSELTSHLQDHIDMSSTPTYNNPVPLQRTNIPDAPPSSFIDTKPTYRNLLVACGFHQVLFRVHDKTSASPLIWTGDPATSGFSSPNPNLSQLTPKTYRQSLHPHYRKDWANDTYKIQTMIDHIMCLHPLKRELGKAIEPDEQSPWISVTDRLDRAIFDCIRRLAREDVDLVRMAIIRRPHPGEPRYNLVRTYPLHVQPYYYLNKVEEWSGIQSLVLHNAKTKCTDWHESLYYGRIFSELVEADLVWTKDVSSFDVTIH